MQTYKKIAKDKNITYFYGKNNINGVNAFILADLTKTGIKDYEVAFEEVVAWVNIETGEIEWADETENLINKDLIKRFIINLIK